MNLADYQRRALDTGSPVRGPARLSLAGMGIAGEAGEVCDLLKKIVHHGRPLDEAARAKLIEEAGDVLWYVALLADELNATLDDVAHANLAKLATPPVVTPASELTKARAAVRYVLRQSCRDPRGLGHFIAPFTGCFERLCAAEAERTGESLETVSARYGSRRDETEGAR